MIGNTIHTARARVLRDDWKRSNPGYEELPPRNLNRKYVEIDGGRWSDMLADLKRWGELTSARRVRDA